MKSLLCVILIVGFVEINSQDVQRSNVSFYFYSRQTGTEALLLTEENYTNILGNKTNKLILHGWTENWQVPWYKAMVQAYLYKGDYNVIAVDYSGPLSLPYFTAVSLVPKIGAIIATAILNFQLDLSQTHFIGHSLGAHIAGFSGKSIYEKTNRKVDRITGLDPAGPSFTFVPEASRLNQGDAKFVDTIHTDIVLFGIPIPIGDADFFPNGGVLQPGCTTFNVTFSEFIATPTRYLLRQVFCSHQRSTWYFVESVNSYKFVATSFLNVLLFPFINQNYAIMGENVNRSTRGNYYLSTNSQSPYALG